MADEDVEEKAGDATGNRSDKVAKRQLGQVLAFNRVKERGEAWEEFQRRAEAEEWKDGEAERRYQEYCAKEEKRKKEVRSALTSNAPRQEPVQTAQCPVPAAPSSTSQPRMVEGSKKESPAAPGTGTVRDALPKPSAAQLAAACRRLDSSSDEGGVEDVSRRHNAMLRAELAARREKEEKKQQRHLQKTLGLAQAKIKKEKQKKHKKAAGDAKKKDKKKAKQKRAKKVKKQHKKRKRSDTSSSGSGSDSSSRSSSS